METFVGFKNINNGSKWNH